jgi:hypothetical protein
MSGLGVVVYICNSRNSGSGGRRTVRSRPARNILRSCLNFKKVIVGKWHLSNCSWVKICNGYLSLQTKYRFLLLNVIILFFLAVLGFEFRASNLLGRWSIALSHAASSFFLWLFWRQGLAFCPGLPALWSSYLRFLL